MVSEQPAAEEAVTLFEKLGICRQLAQSAVGLGWKAPTSIQEQAVPHLLAGRCCTCTSLLILLCFRWYAVFKTTSAFPVGKDVIGLAQTGSGKTGAFAMPILQVRASNTPFDISSCSNHSCCTCRV